MEEDWVQFSLEGPLLLAVGCVGLVGNGFSVWVFARQRVQRVFHHLLLLLAIFDVVYVVCSMLLFGLPMVLPWYANHAQVLLMPYLLPIIHVALVGSIYCTVALAAERYITVCHPFIRYRTSYSSRVFLIPVATFALLYNLPKFFELRLNFVPVGNSTEDGDGGNASFRTELEATEMRKSKTYIRGYLIWTNLLVQIGLPFVTLLVLNYQIYTTIRESEKNLRRNLRVQFSIAHLNGMDYGHRKSSAGQTQLLQQPLLPSSPPVTSQQQNNNIPASNPPPPTNQNGVVPIRPRADSRGRSEAITRIEVASRRDSDLQGQNARPKASSMRRREVTLSKVSIYIVFVFLLCHSIRIVPNFYELVDTYTREDDSKRLSFPLWVQRFTSLSHLMITLSSSVNFYIYFAKHGAACSTWCLRGSAASRNGVRTNGDAFHDVSSHSSSSRVNRTTMLVTTRRNTNTKMSVVAVSGTQSQRRLRMFRLSSAGTSSPPHDHDDHLKNIEMMKAKMYHDTRT